MLARYKGVCKRCGSAYPAGAEVWYDRTTKKVLSCPACESRGKPPPPVLLTRDELRVRVDDVTGRLTPEQRAAVSGSLDGVNRWLATAGAGKTSSLVALVGTLLARGVRPHRIMVTSFTTQAADEIKARLAQAYGPVAHELTLGTFHSLVRKWLLQHARLDGSYNRVDNLLDKGGGQAPAEGEAEDVFDPARPRSPLQLGRPLLGGRKTLIPWLPGKTGLGHEEAGRGMVEDYIEAVGYLQAWLVEPGSERAKKYAAFRKMPLLPEFYSLWTESLLALSLSTYDEWLYLAGKLSQKGSIFLQQRAAQLDYVIVDEAQDNNMAQLVVASSIALEGSGKLVLVGDVAQSMFGFRGALPLFLWQLEKSMPGVKVKTHYLTANFRSTAPIVELANRLIKGRAWNIAPPAGAGRADGAVPVATSILTPLYTDEGEQAASVVKAAATKLALVPSDTRARPIAILGRTHARLARVEAACIQRKVPYQVQEGRGFFGRWEVRVAIAYLLLANGRGRSAKIIKDALSAPRRKLGKVFIDALLQRSPDEDLAQSARVLARRDSRWEQSAQALASDLEAIQNGLDRNGEVICGKPSLFDQGRALLAILTKATAFGVASSERFDNVKALLEIVGDFGSLDDFEKFYRSATQPPKRHEGDADNTNKLVLSTIHACVAPETWVETPMGIGTAGDLPPRGLIGTAGGLAPYTERFQYATAPAIRITVAGGYQITVTPNHGLTSWIGGRDGGDVRVRADQLQIGSWLRLALFAAHDTAKAPLLPLPVAADVRAVQHPVPRHLTEDLAELLGCIVADGTVYRGGFRYHKSDCDVADRVAALCGVLFGKRAARTHVPGPCGGHAVAEFNSTHVAAWLLQLGGVAPRQKAVPTCILQAPLGMQARFLRGLFEDGTVNVTDGVADHVHYDTCREDLARAVQKLLLRFGIISTWKAVTSNGHARHVVYIYGDSIGRFREQIGFISARKNAQLAQASQRHWNLSVPINRTELDWVRHATNPSARQNGRLRGYLSRATAADLAQDAGEAGRFLRERLRWHYAKVVKLEVVQSASVCVEVPNGSRFIQDGFDGWNSKGLEWDEVYLVGANNGVMPHDKSASAEELEEEARIEYVGVTRARHKLHICRYRLDARDQPTYASRSWILAVEARQLAGGAVTELELDEVTRGRDRFAKQAAARAEALAAAKAEKAAKTPQDGPGEVSAQDNPPMAPRSSSRGVDGSSRPPQADGQEG